MRQLFSDACCVCFGLYYDDYGTRREWLQCTCGRGIHEDCIDVLDNDKLCPVHYDSDDMKKISSGKVIFYCVVFDRTTINQV